MRPSNPRTRCRPDARSWAVCVFLLLAIALIYGQTLNHGLLDYDDSGFVFANPHVTAGLTADGVRWAFTEGPFGEWYPLAPLSHMLDCQLFGLHAWGHHLTNVLLHAAASIALFLVVWRMTEELWPSAFVAVIFAIHPQHVESVAWIAERRDVLSGLFFVLTLGAWLGYVRRRSPGYDLLAAAIFTLGLMSKPMLVTLPPLLLLLDFWPLARFGVAADFPGWTRAVERPSSVRLVLEKLPLAALAAGDCLMTWKTHNFGALPLPWSERIGNAAVACVAYVAQFFYPVDLAVFYPNPIAGPPIWKVAGAVAILATASAAAVIWRRRCPYFFVGWFWYLGMLTPVLGLVKVSDHVMADRYMYLAGIGLYIAIAWGAARWAADAPAKRWVLVACAFLVIVVLVPLAAWQTSFWRNDETLWRHALAVTADNSEAEFGLADTLARQGRREEAVERYRRAQSFGTDSAPFNSLGSLLAQEGKLDEAIIEFRRALEIEPDSFTAHANLGMALRFQDQFDEAMKHFHRAIEINPSVITARRGIARILAREGKIDESLAEYERALAIDPSDIPSHVESAQMLLNEGKFLAAVAHFRAALALDSTIVVAHVGLAGALAALGQTEESIALYRRALQLDPDNPAAREELEKLLRGDVR